MEQQQVHAKRTRTARVEAIHEVSGGFLTGTAFREASLENTTFEAFRFAPHTIRSVTGKRDAEVSGVRAPIRAVQLL